MKTLILLILIAAFSARAAEFHQDTLPPLAR